MQQPRQSKGFEKELPILWMQQVSTKVRMSLREELAWKENGLTEGIFFRSVSEPRARRLSGRGDACSSSRKPPSSRASRAFPHRILLGMLCGVSRILL